MDVNAAGSTSFQKKPRTNTKAARRGLFSRTVRAKAWQDGVLDDDGADTVAAPSPQREDRQLHLKWRTFPERRLDPDAAAVHLHDLLGDGKAGAGVRAVDLVELLEDARLMFCRDTRANTDLLLAGTLYPVPLLQGMSYARSLGVRPSGLPSRTPALTRAWIATAQGESVKWGAPDATGGLWDPAAVTELDPQPTSHASAHCGAAIVLKLAR